jgi:hypothetical protein
MTDAGSKPDLLKEYLDRISVRDKSADLKQYSLRLTHLSRLKTLLIGLCSEGFVIEEGPIVLKPGEEAEEPGVLYLPDFGVLKEDVLFYVHLVVGPDLEIELPFAKALSDSLRSNPNLSALVIVWPGDQYLGVVIDSFSIRNYLERGNPINFSQDGPLPVLQAIKEFFSRQFVDWKVSEDSTFVGKGGTAARVADVIRNNLVKHFEFETSRALEIPEKAEAQKSISKGQIQEIGVEAANFIGEEKRTSKSLAKIDHLLDRLTGG